VRATADLAKLTAGGSAKNQARGSDTCPPLPCSDPLVAQRTNVSSPHTRTFAGTHLKIRRILRLGHGTLRTAASRHPRAYRVANLSTHFEFADVFSAICLGLSFEQIELQAKLLNYFLGSNKSNIN